MIATAAAHHNAVYPNETGAAATDWHRTTAAKPHGARSRSPQHRHDHEITQTLNHTPKAQDAVERGADRFRGMYRYTVKINRPHPHSAAAIVQHFAPATVVSDEQNLRVFSATPDARARTCARGRGRAIELREGQP